MGLFQFLHQFDIFRFPLALTFKRLEKTSTFIGKLITFGIIIFLMNSFFTSDLVNKKNPNTLSQDLSTKHRPSIYFSKENFTMILGIADSKNNFFVDETVYAFFLCTQRSNTSDQNSYSEKCKKLELCQPSDFIEDPTEFTRLNLNGTYCLPNETLKISGYWDEEIVENFWIELRRCENSSDNFNICQSEEKINSILRKYYVDIYTTDHEIDASNYENPVGRNLKILYQTIDPSILKLTYLNMKNTLVYTDDGFLFESWKTINSYVQSELKSDYFLKKPDDPNGYFFFNIYSSNYQTQVKRKYEKIQSLLADLGGILNFFLFFGFLLSKIENTYNLFSVISNELFIFPKIVSNVSGEKEKRSSILKKKNAESVLFSPNNPETTTNPKKIEIIELETNRIPLKDNAPENLLINFSENEKEGEEEKTSRENLENLQSENKTPPKIVNTNNANTQNVGDSIKFNWKDRLKSLMKKPTSPRRRKAEENFVVKNLDNYQQIKQKANFFNLGFVGFIKFHIKKNLKCCFKKETTLEEKLFNKAKEQIEDSLDILVILKKIQEIDKLKKILLDNDQLYFFNLLSKPLIYVDEQENSKNIKTSQILKNNNDENTAPKNEKIKEMYLELQNKSTDSKITQRILALLDEDVKFFLEKQKISF